jgi:hypothetical protein
MASASPHPTIYSGAIDTPRGKKADLYFLDILAFFRSSGTGTFKFNSTISCSRSPRHRAGTRSSRRCDDCEPRSQAVREKSETELDRYPYQTCLTLLTPSFGHLDRQASGFLTLGLLHALEMRCGYCISANFVESSSSVHHRPFGSKTIALS